MDIVGQSGIRETVVETTETVGGKEYPLKITKRVGPQEIEVWGEKIRIEALTIFESPLGTSRCYTEASREASEEERAANRENIRRVITQIMVDKGYW